MRKADGKFKFKDKEYYLFINRLNPISKIFQTNTWGYLVAGIETIIGNETGMMFKDNIRTSVIKTHTYISPELINLIKVELTKSGNTYDVDMPIILIGLDSESEQGKVK